MFYTLGPVPYEMPCAQVGSDDYTRKALLECRAYKEQLQRLFPAALFSIKGFPHDFGTYHEVAVHFATEEEEAAACEVENNTPSHWDDEARELLMRRGYWD